MMEFRTIKANLVIILGEAAAGRYQVVGYPGQSKAAGEVLGNLRTVQVFYGNGDFSKGKAGITGPTVHEAVYQIRLIVASQAVGDIATINNPASTPEQKATALAGILNSAEQADASIDELFDIIYQILMDGRNLDLGTTGPPFTVSERWVAGMQKDDPLPEGEYVAITGNIQFGCQMIEQVPGDTTAETANPSYDMTNDIDGDDTEKTGVTV